MSTLEERIIRLEERIAYLEAEICPDEEYKEEVE